MPKNPDEKSPIKIFLVSDWSDYHYIAAESGEKAAHWWYTELAGGPVPQDVKIEEVDPDEIIRCGVEDFEGVSEDDKQNHLHIVLYDPMWEKIGDWVWGKLAWASEPKPNENFQWCGKEFHFRYYVEKPAKLYLKEILEDELPIPCCFCTTAG